MSSSIAMHVGLGWGGGGGGWGRGAIFMHSMGYTLHRVVNITYTGNQVLDQLACTIWSYINMIAENALISQGVEAEQGCCYPHMTQQTFSHTAFHLTKH